MVDFKEWLLCVSTLYKGKKEEEKDLIINMFFVQGKMAGKGKKSMNNGEAGMWQIFSRVWNRTCIGTQATSTVA